MSPAGDAAARGRDAQTAWAATPVRDRLRPVAHLRAAIGDDPSPFVAALEGTGRPRAAESLSAEILPLADACRFLETEAETILAPVVPRRAGRPWWLAGVRAHVRREPLGLVLVIGPSNYPLFLPGVQAVQALVAGNAVLLKPGRGGGAAAAALARALHDGGLDPALLAILDESPEAATAAIENGVDKVVLTGSAETGAAVLERLAPRLVPSVMELSGCDAVFVREDADPALVVRALAFGLRLNGGATCIAPRRVFVARALSGEIEEGLREAAGEIPPRDADPVASSRALDLARGAVAAGARLVFGDLDATTATRPIVLADASPDMPLLSADLFAPIAALVAVDGDDEALAAAARCPYALGASIFGRPAGALALASRVRAGSVVVNDLIVPTADPRLPFGGRGRSGFGVTRGAEGLLDMTTVKAISERRGRFHWHFDPPHPDDEALFEAWLAAAHSEGAIARLRGAARVARLVARRSGRRKGARREARR